MLHIENNEDKANIVSVPMRGIMFLYPVPAIPVFMRCELAICGANEKKLHFMVKVLANIAAKPHKHWARCKTSVNKLDFAHSHVVQLPSIAGAFANMRGNTV